MTHKPGISTFRVLALAGCLAIFSDCTKEPVKGCMNRVADNFSETAEEDDGSCRYSAKTVFYISESVADNMEAQNISYVNVVVDGETIGKLTMSQARSSAPSCEEGSNVVKKTVELVPGTKTSFNIYLTTPQGVKASQETTIKPPFATSGLCGIYSW